jgi:hypothetical protein
VIQLPRPTAGNVSPIDGIVRVRIRPGWASTGSGDRASANAPVAASELRTARRVGKARSSEANEP